MSYDLEIFPTQSQIICWRDIAAPLREFVGPSAAELLGPAPALVRLKTHQAMEPGQPLPLKSSYYLNPAVQNTLGLTLMPNQGNIMDEVEYLEDYGRNLPLELVQRLAAQWQTAGHYYAVGTMAGRSKQEPELFIALAAAVATACQGYVMVMHNNLFDLGIGVYPPEQFRQAKPVFGSGYKVSAGIPKQSIGLRKQPSQLTTHPVVGINTDAPFTFETYKSFLQEVKRLDSKHFDATGARNFSEAERLTRQILQELPPIYRSKLPTYLLARCPICKGQVTEPVDTFSLSGIGWWISEPQGFGWFGRRLKSGGEVIRPLAYRRYNEPSYQSECDHVRAMTYGVNLHGLIPDDIKPLSWVIIGSERSGVLKPFMELAGSYAVIHALPVGRLDDPVWQPRYTAYFVTYFNQDIDSFRQCLAPQDWYHWQFVWPYEEMDYELRPWLEAGKLFWLGSETEGYPLRQEPAGDFPYTWEEGLVGRWATHRERGARLLFKADGIQLDNPHFLTSSKLKPGEAEALQKRGFRRL